MDERARCEVAIMILDGVAAEIARLEPKRWSSLHIMLRYGEKSLNFSIYLQYSLSLQVLSDPCNLIKCSLILYTRSRPTLYIIHVG